jgi:hypothetical protein
MRLLRLTAGCGKPHVRWCGRGDGRNPVTSTRSKKKLSEDLGKPNAVSGVRVFRFMVKEPEIVDFGAATRIGFFLSDESWEGVSFWLALILHLPSFVGLQRQVSPRENHIGGFHLIG